MYLKRYDDVTISHFGMWRILKRLDMRRLSTSQRYKRLDKRCSATRSNSLVTRLRST